MPNVNRLQDKPNELKQPPATNTLRDTSNMDRVLQILNAVNGKQDVLLGKQEILIEKQDVMIETQEVIIQKLTKANNLMEKIVKKL